MRAMAPRRTVLPLVTLVTLALTSCTGSSAAPNPSATDAGPAASNAATAPLLPTHVATLPTFDVQRYQQLLTQLRGTPVVVNVWASWCAPCKAEAPLLHDAAARYGRQVQFLGVDILDSRDGGRSFIADHGIGYPSVFDPPGAIRDSLGMIGQPVTVFYDANGSLVSSWPGQLTETALEQGIRKALG
jgi:cytochrome c biogenesis protein CcmG, thiol:disulfide interchange protein DsbE